MSKYPHWTRERRKGHQFYCSECGGKCGNPMPYCWKCGAKMTMLHGKPLWLDKEKENEHKESD